MAHQLLEIVDGELTVCFEYGNHETLNMKTPSWVTIYKRDASVSLSLTHFHAVVEQDYESPAEHGLRVCTNIDDGRVLVEANAPDMLPGELLLRNGETVWKAQPTQQPERHRLLLTPAEICALDDMACVLDSFDRAFLLGGLLTCWPGSVRHRKHTLTATQEFYFSGDLHTCMFTAGGEITVYPYCTILGDLRLLCPLSWWQEGAWAVKARLYLTHIDVAALIAFNNEQVAEAVVPHEGLQFRLNEERGVGIWPTQADFPSDGDACALVPFTPTEWTWFRACLGLYKSAGFYLKERSKRSAEHPEAGGTEHVDHARVGGGCEGVDDDGAQPATEAGAGA